jgi:hypothetical protein
MNRAAFDIATRPYRVKILEAAAHLLVGDRVGSGPGTSRNRMHAGINGNSE